MRDYAGVVPVQVETVAACLAEFRISLDAAQIQQIALYTELLLRWNRAINLTAICDVESIIKRHFAESIYLTKVVRLHESLLDVGSGAGFPGLALKVAQPDLGVVLLEPVTKKRAFLKEVVRECGLSQVEVSGVRVEDYSDAQPRAFGSVTMRAVGSFNTVLPAAAKCLTPDGTLCLWLTRAEASALAERELSFSALFSWSEPVPIPLSRDREILVGKRKS
jgi:16S rRNA (guanine527-N7)-methyltransferase